MAKKIDIFDKVTHREIGDAKKYIKREEIFGIQNVYPLWIADMEFEASTSIVKALKQRVDHKIFGYSNPDNELFKAVVTWYKKRHNVELFTKNLRTSPSMMTTISASIEAFSKEQEAVTILIPTYPPFIDVVKLQNRVLHMVALVDDGKTFMIDFDALEKALKKSKIFLFCNPHNPTGRVWSKEELEKIAFLCQTYKVTILSDDAHCDIVMPNFKYIHITSVSSYAKQNNVMIFGPGKGFNISGLAISFWFSNSQKLLDRLDRVFQMRYIPFEQLMGYHAAKAAYTKSQEWLDELIIYLDKNLNYATKELNKLNCFDVYKPEGTYLLWINCKKLNLECELKNFFIYKAKLGVSMGDAYGYVGKDHVRINCAIPFNKLCEVIDIIKKLVSEIK